MYRGISRSGGQSGLSSVTIPDRHAVADIYNCHLRVVQTNISPAAGIGTALSLLGNGLVDPFLGTGTPEPAYFNELGQLYNYYRVKSSTLGLYVTNTSTDQPITAILFPTLSNPVQWALDYPTTLAGWAEFPGAYKRVVVGNANSAINYKKVHYEMGTSAIFNNMADVADFAAILPKGGTAGTNPNAPYLWYWGVYMYNADGSAVTPSTTQVSIIIDYSVSIYQPANQTADPGKVAAAPVAAEYKPFEEDLEESVYVKLPKSALKKA